MDRDVYAKLIAKIKSLATKINNAVTDTDTVKTEIGTLTNLTTTAKTDLVSAINELDADINPFNTVLSKQINFSEVAGSGYADLTGTLSTAAKYGIVVGFKVEGNLNLVPLQVFFTDKSTITVRVRNVSSSATSSGDIVVYYV